MRLVVGVLLLFAVACAPSGPPPGYVSRAELGDKWPLTVDEGLLTCDKKGALRVIVFFEGKDGRGRMYAVNGAARTHFKNVEMEIGPIWKPQPEGPFTAVDRLSIDARKQMFHAAVLCEDRDSGVAPAKDCKTTLRRNLHLTPEELKQIEHEGLARSWPPLPPSRMSIDPLIQRGLKLCES